MPAGSDLSAVARMNAILASMVEASLNHYVLLGVPYFSEIEFSAGPFHLGDLDRGRLNYQSKRAGSNFFDLYSSELAKSRLTLTRDFIQVPVIPWQTFKAPVSDMWIPHLVEDYYHSISVVQLGLMLRELADEQEITKALGGGTFDPELLFREVGRWHIAVFLDIGKRKMGWVTSDRTGDRTLSFGGVSKAVTGTSHVLRLHFGLADSNVERCHPLLQQFFRFLAVAQDHRQADRVSEAFLHLVIALDLVFGEKDKSTSSVSDRVAVLSHRGLGVSFDDARKRVKHVYDRRSKYVHEGKSPSESDWEEALKICEVVAFAILRRFRRIGQAPDPNDNWLKRIDLVTATHEGGCPIDPELMAEIGVAREGDFDVADYHKILNKGGTTFDGLGRWDMREFSFLHGQP